MTLLENVYQHLQYNGLVNNREHFSTQYLCRSKHWYAVQTHAGRDFSAAAAINCVRALRERFEAGDVTCNQREVLTEIIGSISKHLISRYSIAELC